MEKADQILRQWTNIGSTEYSFH